MKRNLFSAIFSTKTTKILLIFILALSFLNIHKSYADFWYTELNGGGIGTEQIVFKANNVIIDRFITRGAGTTDTEITDPTKKQEYLTELNKELASGQSDYLSEYSDIIDGYLSDINNITTSNTDQNTAALQALKTIVTNSKSFFQAGNGSSADFTTLYSQLRDRGESYSILDIRSIITIQRRVYIYKQIADFLKTYSGADQQIITAATNIQNKVYNGGTWNLATAEHTLASDEIIPTGANSGSYGQADVNGIGFAFKTDVNNQPIQNPTGGGVSTSASPIPCRTDISLASFITPGVSTSNCSVVAFLVNLTLQGINSIFTAILSLATSIFSWSINFSITNFKDLVAGSGAFQIWQKVILGLVTSLLLPIIFYFIIRMLIDNDTDKIKKVLPGILFTALFVYFSFSVVGWLIDQANVFTLYIWNSLHTGSQGISDSIGRLIFGNNKTLQAATEVPSKGDWGSVPVYAIQLLITGTAILIFFQGAILIFMRGIILVLCMIFSPIMLLPSGINSKIDEYRGMLIKYFTNSVMMAPIFLFLILVALQVGQAAGNMIINTDSITNLANAPDGFMATAISGIISIIVLQLAISLAKKMSGDISTKVSGNISSFVGRVSGGAVLGGTGRAIGRGASALTNNERFQGWIKKGGVSGRLAYNLQQGIQNTSFDVRNNKTFQKATGGNFGQGGGTVKQDFNRRYLKEKGYYDNLNEDAKKSHLNLLRNSGYSRVADKLERKEPTTIRERVSGDRKFNNKFDTANKEVDEKKRLGEINKTIDEHFKENGKGEEYFSKGIEKEENKKIKEDLENANKKDKEDERKNEILKVVSDFEKAQTEKAQNNKNTNNQTQKNPTQKAAPQATSATGANTQGVNTKANGPAASIKDEAAQKALKERLGGMNDAKGLKSQLQKESTAANLKQEAKARSGENQSYTSGQYQKQVMSDLDEKNRPKNVAEDTQKIREGIESMTKEMSSLNKNFSDGLKNLNTSLIGSVKTNATSPQNAKIRNSAPAVEQNQTSQAQSQQGARVGRTFTAPQTDIDTETEETPQEVPRVGEEGKAAA